MNNVTLIGRLTGEPDMRFLSEGGKAVTTFTMAIDKGLSKEKKEALKGQGKPTADFPRIVVWGRQAESCEKYLAKGRMVAIQGSLQTRTYDNNEGNRIYITEIIANRVEFLEWGDKKEASGSGFSESNEDVPF